eukprot:Seg1402.9 transcript_id=Seg1402.9/GoldUCD/mRNA.D3Y31 product="Deoxycytidylate deaminase" protein_id=Seg1402.9/GoldUCD/D3Y31
MKLRGISGIKQANMDSQQQACEELLKNGICDMSLGPNDEDTNNKTHTQLNMHKRNDYIEWPDYFMAIAFLSAQRSKDPSTQVGACIVNEDNKIVGIGYNGMPLGCDDDVMPWNRDGDSMLDTKHAFVCHAEMNAIMNKNSADVKNCTIYVALFPCNECAKLILQSGIKEVIYYSDKYKDRPEMKAAKRMFDIANIKYRQHEPKDKKITIDFSVIDKNKPKSSGIRKLAFSP